MAQHYDEWVSHWVADGYERVRPRWTNRHGRLVSVAHKMVP